MLIERELEEEISNDLKPIFGDVFVDIFLGNVLTKNNKTYIDYVDYFNENEYARFSLRIFTKETNDIDKEIESRKISQFLSEYKYINHTSIVSTFFVKENVFNKIGTEYKDLDNAIDYYANNQKIYNYSYLDLAKDRDSYSDLNNIIDSFKW